MHQDVIAAQPWGNAIGEPGQSYTANRAVIAFIFLRLRVLNHT